jgi:uncharacterized protein (TIGR02453 family)
MAFTGFPPDAITFFEGLEADNSKSYWTANKTVYDTKVKGPMEELIHAVDPRYQPLRLFRPYRDTRFSKDKTPYKTMIGAMGEGEGGGVYYVGVSAEGLVAGSGIFHMANDQLARFREAVDDDRTGAEIAGLVAGLEASGVTMIAIGELKTAPRGYPKDHQRIALLRRKGLAGSRHWPVQRWLHTAKAMDRVQEVWAACDPLNHWLAANVGPSELPPDERELA